MSDRRGFYHQIGCTPAKSRCNTIGSLPSDELKDFKAYETFLLASSLKKYNRARDGDRLGWSRPGVHSQKDGVSPPLQLAFRGILQKKTRRGRVCHRGTQPAVVGVLKDDEVI